MIDKGLIKDPKVLAQMDQYPALGRRTAAQIKGAKLVELEKVDHIPHLEAPEKFYKALLVFLQWSCNATMVLRQFSPCNLPVVNSQLKAVKKLDVFLKPAFK